MIRTPSIGDLRHNRPGNVAILPTAATRKVKQPTGRPLAAAKAALRDSQSKCFPFKFPYQREAERGGSRRSGRTFLRSTHAIPIIWGLGKRCGI